MNRKEKEQIVSDLCKKIEGYKAVVLTHYRGLNVEQISQLRKRLREEKVYYHVIKNTLMRLASKGTDLEKLNDYFEGPTAIAISYGDPILLAKVLSEFIKTQPSLEIKVGLIEGRVAPPEDVKALATMPSREVLLAQILGGIQMSGGQVVGAILSILQQMLGVVQARADQLESEK
ncbi:MAG: 50S ribosomal protein L10 [Deltaproteobacteria bacterium RBG_13_47_9]|nr:MAG: 50S ribosomal protein L10 [Deltaproteobacteria bacterium RBG_13_47_9]